MSQVAQRLGESSQAVIPQIEVGQAGQVAQRLR